MTTEEEIAVLKARVNVLDGQVRALDDTLRAIVSALRPAQDGGGTKPKGGERE